MRPCPQAECSTAEIERMVSAVSGMAAKAESDASDSDAAMQFDAEISNRLRRLEYVLRELIEYRRAWWRSPPQHQLYAAFAMGFAFATALWLAVML